MTVHPPSNHPLSGGEIAPELESPASVTRRFATSGGDPC
jgi:hypothetical protein